MTFAALKTPPGLAYWAALLARPNLVGVWPLDEAAGATSVRDHLARTAGTPTNVTFGAAGITLAGGAAVNAANFGGTGWVNLGPGLPLKGEMTLGVLIRPSSVAAGDKFIFTNCDASGTKVDYALRINHTAGKLGFSHGAMTLLESNATLQAGQTYHVVIVRSGGAGSWTVTLYINGAQDNQAAGVTADPNGESANTALGRLATVGTGYYAGLAGMAFLASSAWSLADVQALYAQA